MPRVVRTVIAATLFIVLSAGEVSKDDGLFANSAYVTELHPDSFPSVVLGDELHRRWAINFYAKWCPHCQHFAPVWDAAASRFKPSQVKFGAVNCADMANRDFCQEVNVTSYPTLRVYDDSARRGASSTGRGVDRYQAEHGDDFKVPVRETDALVKQIEAQFNVESHAAIKRALPKNSLSGTCPTTEDVEASALTAENREHDAKVALSFTFQHGVLQAMRRVDSSIVLHGNALEELGKWLRYVQPRLFKVDDQAKRSLANFAYEAEKATESLSKETWLQALSKNPILNTYRNESDVVSQMKICKTYTCGLWFLFHILTLRADMGDASTLGATSGNISTPEVLERVKGFVVNFFTCDDCRQHFRTAYEGGEFKLFQLKRSDSKGAALWLWKMHSSVTARVAKEPDCKKVRRMAGRNKHVHAWPDPDFCGACWSKAGFGHGEEPNDDAIYEYLRSAYLTEANAAMKKLRGSVLESS